MESTEMTVEHPLVQIDKYLESGVHIGTRYRSGDMRKFIYKCRQDGLCVLDIKTIDERIRTVAKTIARYAPDKVMVVAGRQYAQRPAKKFADMTGAHSNIGRFVPGTLTNPLSEKFAEPEVIFVADPPVDRQAIKEAITIKVPIIALCDTSNLLKNIDLAIPSNNKGKRALALVYWILAREVLKERGIIKSDADFTETIEDFESKAEREERPLTMERMPRGREGFRRGGGGGGGGGGFHRGRR